MLIIFALGLALPYVTVAQLTCAITSPSGASVTAGTDVPVTVRGSDLDAVASGPLFSK